MLKTRYKLLSALVLAAPLLVNTGIATTVQASSVNNAKASIVYKSYYSFANFKSKLDALVASGTINSSQENIILNLYYNGKITTRETFKAQLDALAAAGTITQSQAVSILNTFSGWGSTWKIPAPSKDSHDNKKIIDKTKNTTPSYNKDKAKNNNTVTNKDKAKNGNSASNVAGQTNVH